MIHIEKDQKISENEDLRVATPTGDYDDNALIEFYKAGSPSVIVGSFAAQYIKYGSVVYKFNDAKELGNEILSIDPESTHNAASFVRMNNELLDQMKKGNLEVDSLDKIISDQKDVVEEKRDEETEVINEEVDEEVSDDATAEDTGEVLGEDTTEEPIIVEEEVVDESVEVETLPVVTDEDIMVPETSGDSGVIIPPASEIPSEEPASVAEEIIGFFTNKKSKNSKVARLVSKTRKVAKARRKII